MAQLIALATIPNQSIPTVCEGIRYVIGIRTTSKGDTLATVTRDSTLIVQSVRIVANDLFMRSPYMEGNGGNFLIMTPNDALPDYTLFGTLHNLYYLSVADLIAARAA